MIHLALLSAGAAAEMSWLQAIILSIVEGLTEFLPVSSTGHMIIAGGMMGLEATPFLKAFEVIIQFGAILSVVVLYWRNFFYPDAVRLRGQSWWQAVGSFYLKLFVGLLPAVVIGLTMGKFIDAVLGSVKVVAVMLIVGGVFMLFCDKIFNKGSEKTPLNFRRAFVIGVYQCIAALLPGTSRSMATIVGGMQQKLTRRAAAEFSFFLAVPTMFGAMCKKVYDLVSKGGANALLEGNHWQLLVLGNVVAFIVAIFAIKFFLRFLTQYGFRAFGWYRIIAGVTLLVLMLCGIQLDLIG